MLLLILLKVPPFVQQETSLNFLSIAQNANNNSALIVTSTFTRAYTTAQAVRVSGILSQLLLLNDCQFSALDI